MRLGRETLSEIVGASLAKHHGDDGRRVHDQHASALVPARSVPFLFGYWTKVIVGTNAFREGLDTRRQIPARFTRCALTFETLGERPRDGFRHGLACQLREFAGQAASLIGLDAQSHGGLLDDTFLDGLSR
jgi:hypothetical protein